MSAVSFRVIVTLAASLPADALATEIVSGHTGRGSRGAQRVESAALVPAGTLTLVVGGSYAQASGMFADTDVNTRNEQVVGVVVAPLPFLELSATQSRSLNRNPQFEPRSIQTVGDPTVGFKLGTRLGEDFGAALGSHVLIPTSPGGTGLSPEAYALTVYAALSHAASSSFSTTLNLGYVLDQTGELFTRDISDVQRYTVGTSEVDRIVGGLALMGELGFGERATLAPFLEVSAGIAPSLPLAENAVRLSAGFELSPFGARAVSFIVGSDVRLAGAPTRAGELPGVPPWEAFARLAAPFGHEPAPLARCDSDAACGNGQVCDAGRCAVVRELVREVEKAPEVVPTFIVQGAVLDALSGDPVRNAVIQISGADASALAVDYRNGEFKSYPLSGGEGLVQLTATAVGYRPAQQTLARSKGGLAQNVILRLQPTDEQLWGELRGSIKDAATGQPIGGAQLIIAKLNQTIASNAEGVFSARVVQGVHQVVISAPAGASYVVQRKSIEIRAGDTVILNIDMAMKR